MEGVGRLGAVLYSIISTCLLLYRLIASRHLCSLQMGVGPNQSYHVSHGHYRESHACS